MVNAIGKNTIEQACQIEGQNRYVDEIPGYAPVIFTATELAGAYDIEIERFEDERGFFARSWCKREAAEHGIDVDFVQCNISQNINKGTLKF